MKSTEEEKKKINKSLELSSSFEYSNRDWNNINK